LPGHCADRFVDCQAFGRCVANVSVVYRPSRTPPRSAEIRQRTELDLAECVRILAAVHERDGYPTRWPSDPAEWLNPRGLLKAWVTEIDGAVCGHIALVEGVDDPLLLAAMKRPSDELAAVSRLFADPAVRGNGVGAALLDAVGRFAEEHQRGLVLDVVDDRRSAAIALYEQLGWRLVGHRRADWATRDGVRLQLRLYVLPAEGASD
jgi:GNAT superfamily N-acetyltransferase